MTRRSSSSLQTKQRLIIFTRQWVEELRNVSNKYQNEISQILRSCTASIQRIRQVIDKEEARKDVNDQWTQVCYRIDVCLLLVTECTNVIILIVWLTTPGSGWFRDVSLRPLTSKIYILINVIGYGRDIFISVKIYYQPLWHVHDFYFQKMFCIKCLFQFTSNENQLN
jgi:hypothetical protein